jgi:hypothetical protein
MPVAELEISIYDCDPCPADHSPGGTSQLMEFRSQQRVRSSRKATLT